MERSSKRGKIPQQDWPSIIKRYEAGETLASIARTYDCSPPAISYIVSRSRARDTAPESTTPGATGPSEPRLVKGNAGDVVAAEKSQGELLLGATRADRADNFPADASYSAERLDSETQQIKPSHLPNEAADAPDLRKDPALREGDGAAEGFVRDRRDANSVRSDSAPASFAPAGMPQDSEPRRTLHLALPHDGAHSSDAQHQDAPATNSSSLAVRPGGDQQGFAQIGRQGPAPYPPATNGAPVRMMSEPQRTKEGNAFIDQALRERVDGDITAFLAAFDAALAHDTLESRAGLREATDRLLRAGARTRIELERLEARVPLPPRDNSGQAAPAWRQR